MALLPAYGDLVRHSGNEDLQRALELSLLACLRGQTLHVHVEGLRGTGKTTVIRAAAGLLGPIPRIAGCPYNCDPERPHCPLHRALSAAERTRLGTEWVPAPFLEVSASARIGTVVGSIDLGRLTAPDRTEAALLPGTLARAHRGIVFVDEVNRLADTSPELADALLDVMGTKPGRLQIEEPGLPPVVLACNVSVWAASNPDEEPGPLADVRRQLADRFDLAVAMRRPAEPEAVFAVLSGALAGEASGGPAPEETALRAADAAAEGGPTAPWSPVERRGEEPGPSPGGAGAPEGGTAAMEAVPAGRVEASGAGRADGSGPERLGRFPPSAQGSGDERGAPQASPRTLALRAGLLAQSRLAGPAMPEGLRMLLAKTYCAFQLESLRAVVAWQAAAALAALRAGRDAVALADLAAVAPGVLRHRLDPDELAQVLQSLGQAPQQPVAEAEASWTAGSAAPPAPAASGGSAPACAALWVEGDGDPLSGAISPASAAAGDDAAWDPGAAPPPPRAGSPPAGAGRSFFGRLMRHATRQAGRGADPAAPRRAPGGHAAPAAVGSAGDPCSPATGRAKDPAGPAPSTRAPGGDAGGQPSAGTGGSMRLADPRGLPPLAPATPARLLEELSAADLWRPVPAADPVAAPPPDRGGPA